MKYNLVKIFNEPKITKKKINDIDFGDIPDHLSPRERLWLLINDLHSIPLCEQKDCDNTVKWDKNNRTYRTFCSVRCAARCKELQNIKKNTLIEKFGVDNPSKSSEIKKKKKATVRERYGCDHYSQTNEYKDKIKSTSLKKYNTSHMLKSPVVRQKINNTIKERYGVNHHFQSDDIKNKIKNYYQTSHDCDNFNQIHIPKESLSILNNQKQFVDFCQHKTVKQIADALNVDNTTIHQRLHQFSAFDIIERHNSNLEIEMAEFLNNLNVVYSKNSRNLIAPFELDFFLPDYNIAIEMNGVYWHSDKFRDKNYHFDKWNACNEQNIHLLSITDIDWYHQNDKIKNIIKSLLGFKKPGLGARKLSISKIDGSVAKKFLNQYHLQGWVAGLHYGAVYNNSLVGIMTFGKSRNQIFELKRFVTDNHTYPGLFSKMFKTAQQEIKFEEIVSFSDNSWFTGEVYNKCGFVLDSIVKPAHHYYFNKKIWHCSKFTKSNLRKMFPELSDDLDNGATEFEITNRLNILRIWDCGKKKWIWKLND